MSAVIRMGAAAARRLLGGKVVLPVKPNKFHNRPQRVDGMYFPSQRELGRWQVLKLRARLGEIRALRRQVPFELCVGHVLVGTYIADFVYDEHIDDDWAAVVEDAKGVETEGFRLKWKLAQALNPQIRHWRKT